ncbi:PREDICTED: C-type lectin domain family 2 member E-like [Charadrius vociferus]|uniref:C-type lectin domain family 2 member E-like n=1 Tax=Charadrius vociferus TaxID=50402 RepID=UPI0005217F3C|nr:PREDICTED: C-type lectin domain family 2 member E-like [Charadrius vociferus]
MSSQQRAKGEGTNFSLKCIKDKKIPIGVTVVVAALLLTIIALAAKKCPSCPSYPSPVLPGCRENGIGYGEKCFYFVEDEADWNGSAVSCLSLGAHLATVDSREELVNEKPPRNWFDVRGDGRCAYVHQDGISSDWCSRMKSSVCSHPQKVPRRDPEGFRNPEFLLTFPPSPLP